MEEWKAREKELLALGYSKHAVHEEIAKYYNVESLTIWRYLEKGVHEKHKTQKTYKERAEKAGYKAMKNFHKNFRRNPARYVVPLFSNWNESISIEELSVRIQDWYGYLPHIKMLEQMLTQENPPYRGKKSKGVILQQVSSKPASLYVLVEGLYERCKRC